MRKRHIARPLLESMEDRMVLSAVGAAHPAAEIVTTRHTRDAARGDHAATTHAAQEAVKARRHAARAAHPATQPKAAKKSTSTPSVISSFFKSVFGGL